MIPKGRRKTFDRSRASPRVAEPIAHDSYWARSTRPLHVLVFLLPLVIAYEIGSIKYLADPNAGVQSVVVAYRHFNAFFQAFGLAGAFLPGIALLTVLLAWHVIAKDRWRLDPRTLAGMLAESVAWTMPLLVLSAAANHARGALGLVPGAPDQLLALAADARTGLAHLPPGPAATIAVGAGLYEEMLFRLVGLAVLHFILVDLIGLPQRWGFGIAIVLSALAFAIYHQPDLPREWPTFVFMTAAGVYFGVVYVMRGFGIVVATHALYDLLVLVVFPRLAGG